MKPSPAFFEAGLAILRQPIAPLLRLVQLLFMATPHESVSELIAELTEAVETEGVRYGDPRKALAPYMNHLHLFHFLKEEGGENLGCVYDEAGTARDPYDALGCHVIHRAIMEELEQANSLLCAPCGCTLCCTGPLAEDKQLFFEIPLQEEEKTLFPLAGIDTSEVRTATPHDEPAAAIGGKPFFAAPPALYHWRDGWSMILPKGSVCPRLLSSGQCAIYVNRPEVCRRPQIFSYLLEPLAANGISREAQSSPAFVARKKLLAIWDCPYVRRFQEEIADYADKCGLEVIFKENKR